MAVPVRGGADYDVAILGGGLAGLSLAVRLAARPDLRVLVVEPRPAYRRDRTWCCWRIHDHPFADAVAGRWTRWSVSDERRGAVLRGSERYPYELIPADRVYEAARRTVAAAPGIDLRLGTSAGQVAEFATHVAIETGEGTVTADHVFDSRPPPASPSALVQRFLGQEIETDRPCFEPGRATLMDFAVPQRPGAIRFMYVLPLSPTVALLEDTWFAPAGLAVPDPRAAIRDYLGAVHGAPGYRVLFEEEGAIPMDPDLQAPETTGRVVPIGTAGGAVKPSSGYAFLAVQRMADGLAADLAAGRPPAPPRPRSRTARWMDAVFLSALQDRPEEGPAIFHALFRRCRPEPLIRFLNDLASPADIAEVVAATPKWAMMAAAARVAIRR